MSTVLFLRGKNGRYEGFCSRHPMSSVQDGIRNLLITNPEYYPQYEFMVWFVSRKAFTDIAVAKDGFKDLYEQLAKEATHAPNVWWRIGTHWFNSVAQPIKAEGDALPRTEMAVPGPRKPPPALPMEVWNTKSINTDLAMSAMRDLCKGQAGA